jgi:hypothetical protein
MPLKQRLLWTHFTHITFEITVAWNAQELVDDLIAGFCHKSLHEEALDILDLCGMAIKDVTFERALKTQVLFTFGRC